MPLSEHEQRILAEIERHLLEEDPKFAQQVGSKFSAHLSRRLKLAAAGFILGLAILLIGFVKSPYAGLAGVLVMLVSVVEFIRTLRRRAAMDAPAAPPGPAPPRPRPGRGGLEGWWSRMNERWRQRWEERGGGPPPP